MESNDQRNLLFVAVATIALFMMYQLFVLEPQNRQRAAAQRAHQAQAAQVQQAAPSQPLYRPHDQVVAEESAAGQRVALDAPAVNGSISLKGARIDDVALKGFYDTLEDKKQQRTDHEVRVLSPDGTDRAFYAAIYWQGTGANAATTTDAAMWAQTNSGSLNAANPLKLSFTGQGVKIERTIAIDSNYMFTVTDTLTNTSGAPVTLQPIAQVRQRNLVELSNIAKTNPKMVRAESQALRGALGTFDTKTNQTKSYPNLVKGPALISEVQQGWIGLTTKYWMASVIPPQGEATTLRADYDRPADRFISSAEGKLVTIAPGQSVNRATRIFAGAKRVRVLQAYEKEGVPGFVDSVDWSWMWFITKPFFFLLQMFQGWFGSFAAAIFALTVVVKTVFFPIQFNMYRVSARMRKLQPEMDSLSKRFAADPQRLQQERLKLWQREKINPVAGCLPMIPQVFVFYSLFHTLSVTLEMRQTPFVGWIQDMSAPDPTTVFNLFGLIPWDPSTVPVVGGYLMMGVWPLLYGLTMVILQFTTTPPTDPTQKMVMRWMPAFYLLFLSQIASGLAIYYVWSNLISIGIQYYCMRHNGVETDIDTFFRKLLNRGPKQAEPEKKSEAPQG